MSDPSRRRGISASARAIRASVFAELAPRIAAHTTKGGALAPLHIGDTHRAPPEAARFERVIAEAPHGLYGYGPLGGDPELLEVACDALARAGRGPPGLTPAGVLVGAGATHALFCAARAVLDDGDEVLVPSPYWPLSVGIFHACGASPVEVWRGAGLAARLAGAVTERTRAVYVTTPNNPCGEVLDAAALAAIAEVARAHDLWVLADEVYADYAYAAPHASIARLPGMAERTLTATSLSKSHALAGARVGLIAGDPEVIAAARRVATHTVFNVPVVAQRAAARAIARGEAWVAEARAEYRAAAEVALAAVLRTGARAVAPDGGSYVFADFEPVLGGRPLARLLERAIDHGVLVAPGDAFGRGFEAWARVCFTAVTPAALPGALGRLEAAVDAFRRDVDV